MINYLSEKISYQSFQRVKPTIIEILEKYLQNKTTSKHSGRKRTFDLNLFLDAIFQLLDNGDKSVWLKTHNQRIAGSYKRYLRLLKDSNALQIAFDLILEKESEPFKLFADSFIVKSIDGSQGVGPNPTDRFRNGIKCGLLIDERGVIWRSAIVTANKSENAVLNQLLKKPFKTSKAVFTDAGFCFKPDAHAEFRKNGIRVVTKPKLNTPKKGI